GRSMTCPARPHLPVREVLVRLGIVRPALVPAVGRISLAPAARHAQASAKVDVVPLAEGSGDLNPCLALGTQGRGKFPLFLPDTPSCHTLLSRSRRSHTEHDQGPVRKVSRFNGENPTSIFRMPRGVL